ncbi:MAG: sugar ABC transporter permease [SAR324 cluster bacterium]|nr:sugar ABC transporter permease [SAR324 cluster bacterium]
MHATVSMSMQARRRANLALFLGPACVLLLLFYVVPVVADLAIAFTDMGRTLQVTEATTRNFERLFAGDPRLTQVASVTLLYVFGTVAVFNVTYGLLLALMTTAVHPRAGAFFRTVWLLPRMSPSVVYALLWAWTIDPTETGLLNQVLHGALGLPLIDWMNDSPVLLIVFVNGFIGASMGMIILTSAIRAIPDHLIYAARADGAGGLAIVRHVILPSIRWPLSFVTVYQTLSLLVSFEYIWLVTNGGPFYDTMVYALYVYKRAFETGFYAYGAAMTLVLVAVGAVAALAMWRFMDMRALMQRPRIEVH